MRCVSFWSCAGSMGVMRFRPFTVPLSPVTSHEYKRAKHEGGAGIPPLPLHKVRWNSALRLLQTVEPLREAIRMGPFRFGECLEPFGEFRKPLIPSRFGHAGIHLRVFVGFAFDGGL